ncbi:MAG: hypothetical protein COV44_03665 [Deltaproteobacteria bacterium CG11_big_fil_rev_8_21_14_0_20_45_16]|nr:MAG: hypothetical protein COV44_03665 [Deltaproteobacteria bacterium CG11_big_fil_rev_8_21_14_0_20_45_16]
MFGFWVIVSLSSNLVTLGHKSAGEEIICAADVEACADGSYVARDPKNQCKFKACPKSNAKPPVHLENCAPDSMADKSKCEDSATPSKP